jgi:hypothetical protein
VKTRITYGSDTAEHAVRIDGAYVAVRARTPRTAARRASATARRVDPACRRTVRAEGGRTGPAAGRAVRSQASAGVAAPAPHVDQRVSENGANSRNVAFETRMSEQPCTQGPAARMKRLCASVFAKRWPDRVWRGRNGPQTAAITAIPQPPRKPSAPARHRNRSSRR